MTHREQSEPRAPRDHLITRREAEVLALMVAGLTNHEIGERLHLSHWTVKRHLARVAERLGLRRRVELAVWFTTHGRDATPPEHDGEPHF